MMMMMMMMIGMNTSGKSHSAKVQSSSSAIECYGNSWKKTGTNRVFAPFLADIERLPLQTITRMSIHREEETKKER
jgi:hypothetical protein